MDLHLAIEKSVRAYWKGVAPVETMKASGKKKYDKKYFDKVGRENNIDPFELKGSKKVTPGKGG